MRILDSELRKVIREKILESQKLQPRDPEKRDITVQSRQRLEKEIEETSMRLIKNTGLFSRLKKLRTVEMPIFNNKKILFSLDSLASDEISFDIPNALRYVGSAERPLARNIGLSGKISNFTSGSPSVSLTVSGRF